MLRFFKKLTFEDKVRSRIANSFKRDVGNDVGATLFYVFEAMVERAQNEAGMPQDFLQQIENSGMSDNAGAIALLDASITGAKKLISAGLAPEDLNSTVFVMERTLDRLFLDHPSEVVPRNGTAGPSMNDFTQDWNP